MLFDLDLRGDTLPPRTLCLTFDDGPGQIAGDGPGPKTIELGLYLAECEIAATFFVVGTHVRANPGIVARLRAMGHLVGNHTDTHPSLLSFLREGGDVAGEIAQADLAIGSPSAEGLLTFFRAPYGEWRDDPDPSLAGVSEPPVLSPVAALLNEARLFPHLVGPIGWDIDAADWRFWQEDRTAEACGAAYLAAIEEQERGIVLMHDSAETEALRAHNLTLEMVRWLVPILLERDYHFVRLDEVPGVASASRVTREVSFRTEANQWLTCPEADPILMLTLPDQTPGGCERFGIVPVEKSSTSPVVALLAWNGRYLSRTPDGAITPNARTIEPESQWELVEQPGGIYHLHAASGAILTAGDHPRAVRLATDNSLPLTLGLRTVVAVDHPGTTFSEKGE